MKRDVTSKSKNLEAKRSFFEKACYKHGLKITPQRVAIYKELSSSQKHPSAIMIFRRIRSYFPNISLGTVNNTLLTFAQIGLARVVESSGDPKRFDPKLEPHHHFRCLGCGKIVDFYDDDYDAIKIPAAMKKRFIILGKTVHLEGFCEKCRGRIKK